MYVNIGLPYSRVAMDRGVGPSPDHGRPEAPPEHPAVGDLVLIATNVTLSAAELAKVGWLGRHDERRDDLVDELVQIVYELNELIDALRE